MKLEEYLAQIKPFDQKAADAAWAHWDSLCKPLRGMGKLEDMVVQLAGIYGTEKVENPNPVVVIMGADNGVVAEGVSQTGSEVTAQVLENMGERISSASWPARRESRSFLSISACSQTESTPGSGTGPCVTEPEILQKSPL